MASEVEIQVKLIATQALSSLKTLEAQAQKNNSVFNTLGKGAVFLNQGFQLISSATQKLTGIFSGCIDAAIEQENAVNELTTALKGAGITGVRSSQELQLLAAELQKTTTFSDETTLSAISLYVQLNKTSIGIKEAVIAAQNLSARFGTDLNSAMLKIIKSSEDGGAALKRYGIVITEGATKAETMANAAEAVNNKIGGTAASKVNTYSGAIIQAKNAWSDLLEGVGTYITTNPQIITAIKTTTDLLIKLATIMASPAQKAMAMNADQLKQKITDVGKEIEKLTPVAALFKTSPFALQIKKLTEEQKTYADQLILLEKDKNEKIKGSSESHYLNLKLLDSAYAQYKKTDAQALMDLEVLKKDSEFETLALGLGEKEALDILYKAQELERNGQHNDAMSALKKGYNDSQKALDAKAKTERENSLSNLFNFEKIMNGNKVANFKDTLGTIATLQDSNNKALVIVGKAAALAQITISTAEGVAKCWSLGPILGAILAPLVITAGAMQAAKVMGVKLQEGGIVPGSSYYGDNQVARINSGEMVLNRDQQQNLFNSIANNNLGGNVVNIHIAGNVISDDENIEKLARKLSDAVEFRNVELRASA
jgi:hypothetical protein